MPAGLTVINDGNTVQIDENWKNYGYRQRIPVTVSVYDTSPPNPPGFNGYPYQLAVGGTPQLLVGCRANSLFPIRQWSYYDSGVWYTNWLFMKPPGVIGTVTETVWFYIFDAMDSAYSNVGLEVFDASGARVFHSDAPVMRLGSYSVSGVQGCNVQFNGDSGREYCPVILVPPFWTANVGLGNRHFCWGNRSIGNVITGEAGPQLGAFGSLTAVNLPGLYAAIDVTGFT